MEKIIVRNNRDSSSLRDAGYYCLTITRGYALGNPFLLDEDSDESRSKVISLFKRWLWANLYTTEPEVIPAVCEGIRTVSSNKLNTPFHIKQVLYNLLLHTHKNPNIPIALLCCCYPKPCHGDCIVSCLNWLSTPTLSKVISGGQTGADYAGLQAAHTIGISTGGTAPKNYRICLPNGTDSINPSLKEFGLVESDSYSYQPRTIKNVLDSDGTVWFGYQDSPGGKLTLNTCRSKNKPYIVNPTSLDLYFWVKTREIKTLNVAGNRMSNFNPTITQDVYKLLTQAFTYLK